MQNTAHKYKNRVLCAGYCGILFATYSSTDTEISVENHRFSKMSCTVNMLKCDGDKRLGTLPYRTILNGDKRLHTLVPYRTILNMF